MTDLAVRAAWRSLQILPTPEAAIAWLRASLRAGGWPKSAYHRRGSGDLWRRAPVLFQVEEGYRRVGDEPGDQGERWPRTHAWPRTPLRQARRGARGKWWWPELDQATASQLVELVPACDDGALVLHTRYPEFVGGFEQMLAWLAPRALAVRFPLPVRVQQRCPSCKKRRKVTSSGTCRWCALELASRRAS